MLLTKTCFCLQLYIWKTEFHTIFFPYKLCVPEKRNYVNELKPPLLVLLPIPFNKLPCYKCRTILTCSNLSGLWKINKFASRYSIRGHQKNVLRGLWYFGQRSVEQGPWISPENWRNGQKAFLPTCSWSYPSPDFNLEMLMACPWKYAFGQNHELKHCE